MAKHKRYTPEQITRVLKQQEAGMKVAETATCTGYDRVATVEKRIVINIFRNIG